MVRLLRDRLMATITSIACFNPTMVRLLRIIQKYLLLHYLLFQSHNGAIAAVEIKSNKGAVV